MEMDTIILGLVVLLLVAMAIPLWMGKGAWLIAGYNTASKEEQEKYDVKKLCRLTACILLVCAGFLILQSCSMVSPIVSMIGITVLTIIMIVYANTGCKKK